MDKTITRKRAVFGKDRPKLKYNNEQWARYGEVTSAEIKIVHEPSDNKILMIKIIANNHCIADIETSYTVT